jgi:hypothetical protein
VTVSLLCSTTERIPGTPIGLLRIISAGEATVGPFLHGRTTWKRSLFAGFPARLFHGHTIASVTDGLDLIEDGKSPIVAMFESDRMTGHAPGHVRVPHTSKFS